MILRIAIANNRVLHIWSVDIITPLTKKVAAVQVDGCTGKVLSKLAQNPSNLVPMPLDAELRAFTLGDVT